MCAAGDSGAVRHYNSVRGAQVLIVRRRLMHVFYCVFIDIWLSIKIFRFICIRLNRRNLCVGFHRGKLDWFKLTLLQSNEILTSSVGHGSRIDCVIFHNSHLSRINAMWMIISFQIDQSHCLKFYLRSIVMQRFILICWLGTPGALSHVRLV